MKTATQEAIDNQRLCRAKIEENRFILKEVVQKITRNNWDEINLPEEKEKEK